MSRTIVSGSASVELGVLCQFAQLHIRKTFMRQAEIHLLNHTSISTSFRVTAGDVPACTAQGNVWQKLKHAYSSDIGCAEMYTLSYHSTCLCLKSGLGLLLVQDTNLNGTHEFLFY